MLRQFISLLVALFFVQIGLAQTASEPKLLRAGGEYLIKSIKREKDRSFQIFFESIVKTGKYDLIRLQTDHLHFAVREGMKLKVSAEITSSGKNFAEASQVLVFLPHPEGLTPVWLLSKDGQEAELRASKFIDMHAPQSDFRVF